LERTRSRILIGVLSAAFVVISAYSLARAGRAVENRAPIPGEGDRLVVEVLNATRIDGLARAMTRRLRAAGIDVVYFGSSRESLDSTLILIRRGDSAGAVRVRGVLGAGRIVEELDPRLLLDVSVLLGLDVAPPGKVTP
jgi:hypothetical protein